MKITYPDGMVVEALMLSRGKDTLRAAIPGEDDARTFTLVNDNWLSEECVPVQITFEWDGRNEANAPTEGDCICSKALASHLTAQVVMGASGEELLDDILWISSLDGRRLGYPRRRIS
jgi:hypothetical protein